MPDSNYNLYCAYENNGTQKIDLFAEIKTIHQTNRLKGYEPLIIAFSNSIYYFEQSLKQEITKPIKNNFNLKIIEHAAKNYLEYTKKIKIDKLKIILVVSEISSAKQKIYFN